MSRYARKVDATHRPIADALKAAGWSVWDVSRLPNFVDLIIAKGGRVVFVEVKDGSKVPSARRIRENQSQLHDHLRSAGASVLVLTSVEEAVQV